MTKTWSCESLHHAIYAAPDVLRHCCKRFFVGGEMRGDVEIFKVTSDSDLAYENIRTQKAQLYTDINEGKETPCNGCPWLVKRDWPSLDKLDVSLVSIEHHSVCNLRCTYCSDIYYGGKKPAYDVKRLFENLSSHQAINQKLTLVWGGGEPVLFGSFDKLFSFMADRYKPVNNHVFTNAIRYSAALEEYLKRGEINITVSLDAGTSETFKLVRGRDRFIDVLTNLGRYHRAGGDRVIIKYILMPENSSEDELASFIRNIKQYGLQKCTFQISSDFKDEIVGEEVISAARFLLSGLKKLGTHMINFDYHLRPRVDKTLGKPTRENLLNTLVVNKVIVWGAGEYALRLVEDKLFSNKIRYFVDSDPVKQGGEIEGIKINTPSTILSEINPLIFIASSQYYSEIYHELTNMGISADNILDANSF